MRVQHLALAIQNHLCSLLVNMFGGRVQFFKDQNTSQAANSVFSEMRGILNKFEPEPPKVDNSYALPLVSVEQAIKELLELENEANQKKS